MTNLIRGVARDGGVVVRVTVRVGVGFRAMIMRVGMSMFVFLNWVFSMLIFSIAVLVFVSMLMTSCTRLVTPERMLPRLPNFWIIRFEINENEPSTGFEKRGG